MHFQSPLVSGILIKRYKRFLADICLDSGEEITAHCPNPGAMMGITIPDSKVLLSKSTNPNRKLAYTWEMVEINKIWIGVNTNNPNLIVAEALKNKAIPELASYKNIRAEVKYGNNSRIDFLLTNGITPMCLVEVKNVHLIRENKVAEFPDCVTARGAKHQQELLAQVQQGVRCVMLYVIQRKDAKYFKLAGDLDPFYAKASKQASEAGVEVLAYACDMQKEGIFLNHPLSYIHDDQF